MSIEVSWTSGTGNHNMPPWEVDSLGDYSNAVSCMLFPGTMGNYHCLHKLFYLSVSSGNPRSVGIIPFTDSTKQK
eukprot:9530365-Ditylum_brightwellii.AAC.2